MPPEARLDWREMLIVSAALRTDLLPAFSKRTDLTEVARNLHLDERAVGVVAKALAKYGYLALFGESAVLTARGKAVLRPDGDLDPGADILLGERAIRNHLRLEEILRGASPEDDVSGGDPVLRRRFMGAMRHIASVRAPATAEALAPGANGARLLDVGGAPGTYGSAFAAAGWDVTIFDQPEMLDAVVEDLQERRLNTIGGDVRESFPTGPWDAVYLGNVLHLFDRDTAFDIVVRAASTLAPQGRLAIQEMMLGHAPQAESFGVMMLVSTESGSVYDEQTYRDWMIGAGVEPESLTSLDDDEHQLLIGRRT